ncbi:MAG: DUF2194 domain-containing protein [Firmicutes bacterium]|nr:DUF2194 domain-containing protein [Bacillota bacterium]
MVSRRNFFSICTMMAVLFFMFQFFLLFKEGGNAYDINAYVGGDVPSGTERWEASEETDAPDILFLGKAGGELANVVSQWCLYTKHSLTVAESPEQMLELLRENPAEMLLIDGESLELPLQEETLLELAETGTAMVFLRLPQARVLESCTGLKSLLGISEVAAFSVETEGIQLYSGFLLGGGVTYKVSREEDKELQDLVTDVSWYRLGKGTKVYMTGLLDEDEIEREMFPPIVWRNNFRGTFVFAVNGNYMTRVSGMGFLSGFVYELEDYALYPVVNAQNATIANFPGFAGENVEKLNELYSRSPGALQQDVMWPGLSALSDLNKRKLTCFFMAQYDYGDDAEPSGEDIVFFLQQLKEISGEAGQTLEYKGNVSLAEKLVRDRVFWKQNDISYQFSAYYAGEILEDAEKEALTDGSLENVRTVVSSYREGGQLLSYYNDGITVQCVTGNASTYTYSRDLQLRSLDTALGYSNLLLDMKPAFWPQSKEEQWENYFDEISSNVGTYWLEKDRFESTTLTESDRRVRNFLNLEYTQFRQGDTITINTERAEEAWFLLRTHGETVKEMQGGDYRCLEDDTYLIHITAHSAQLQLEKKQGETEFYFPG